MIYDFTIVGNGALGLSSAMRLSEEFRNSKILLIGSASRNYSGTKASGAMIASYAEIKKGDFEDKKLFTRFKITNDALNLWDNYKDKINEYSNVNFNINWNTKIIIDQFSTPKEYQNFNYLHKFLLKNKKLKKNDYSFKSNNKFIYCNDGYFDTRIFLKAFDSYIFNKKNIHVYHGRCVKVDSTKNDIELFLNNNKKIKSKILILTTGYEGHKILDKSLHPNIQSIYYGKGVGIVGKINKINSKYIFEKEVKRTLDKDGGCGLHFIPFHNNEFYIGATSKVLSQFENARMNSVNFLIDSCSKSINKEIYRSHIKKIAHGFRPVSRDFYPLLGNLIENENIWILNGMKRDGLTASPNLSLILLKSILKGKSMFPKVFKPQRKYISYKDKKSAIKEYVENALSHISMNNYNLNSLYNNKEATEGKIYNDVRKKYSELKIEDIGIHPELLDIFDKTGR